MRVKSDPQKETENDAENGAPIAHIWIQNTDSPDSERTAVILTEILGESREIQLSPKNGPFCYTIAAKD